MRLVLAVAAACGALVVSAQPKKAVPKKAPAPAPAKPTAPAAVPLSEIKVTGNKNYTVDAIAAASGLKIGQPMKEADFEPARERLMATGGFESVGFRYAPDAAGKGYSLTFEVLEIERTLPIRFEDLPAAEAELRKLLIEKEPLFGGERAPGHQAVLDRMARSINEYLASAKGYKETVAAKVRADAPDELYVLFRPSAGKLRIAQVAFEGNRLLDNGMLGNAFGPVAIGEEFKEDTARKLLDSSVRPHYEARGRLGVKWTAITTAPMKEVEGVAVTVQIEEGKPYKYKEISAKGNGVSLREAVSIAGLKAEDIANFETVNEVPKKLVARMQQQGFMRSKAGYDRKVDDQALTVDITFKTEAGPQYLFGKLTIQGLDVIGEPAVRKIWGLKAGRPYNADYPQYFLNNVKEQGLFDGLKTTRFETKLNDKDLTADVTLYFR